MKKLFTLLALALTLNMVSAQKCNWSGYWMKKVGQQQNVYTFKTNLDGDPCVDYHWIIYDYQLKRFDTVSEVMSGITQISFNTKGKYKVGLKAVNKCTKPWCDTLFYQIIDITVYGSKAKLWWNIGAKNCKSYTFEMFNIGDTCINYYYYIYKGDDWVNKMSDREWEKLTDSAIYFGYSWDDKYLKYSSKTSERVLRHEFADSGRHILYTFWQNKCTGIDTFAIHKLNVCLSNPSMSITKFNKPEPKLIGVYDMMGRRVYNIRENEIMVYIYSDGTRKKVVRK